MPKCELCPREAKAGIPFCDFHQPEFFNIPEMAATERKMVLVETDRDGVIRIFRTTKTAVSSPAWDENRVARIDRGIAVGQIRRRVFDRAEYECEKCSAPLVWETGRSNSGEMHEKQPKGMKSQKFGEVSLENCELLCRNCHTGSDFSAHGNRRWQSSKRFTEFA